MAGKSPISPVWGQILWQFSVCFQVFHFIPIITRRISIMSIIIGIDHGYYAIKTAHSSFPAGLISYGEHEPYTDRKSVV